jgi:PAS domain S-box-containing protein
MPIRGLREECYRTGKAVYHNDFSNSEWVKFMPEGHASLDNVLFAPLIIDGEVLGLLGLANKPDGFTEDDARMGTAFGELASVALHNSRTLESLENSEERFRSVVETANDAIVSIDRPGNIVFWNEAAKIIFGYATGEVIGKPVTLIMPERFREAHRKGMERILTTEEFKIVGRTVELAGLRKDGSEFPMELSLASWKTGEEIFFTAIIRDITDRKRAEEQVENLAKFPSENPNPVLRVTKDGILLYANAASESLLSEWNCKVGQSVSENWQQTVCEVLASNSAKRVEATHDGKIFAFMVAPVPEAEYANLYGRDITERRQAEQEIQSVAKFPSENPYPVIRIARDGIVLYANTAGDEVLKDWKCKIGGRASEHWQQYVLRILGTGSSEELEVVCGDKVFSMTVAPIVDAGYVNIYGADITERKQAEEDLRKYRQHLEGLVEKRTVELTDANKQLLQEIEGRKLLEREILDIGEREQRRIGQELHDSIGQQFTGIAFMTKVLSRKLSEKSPEEAADAAEIANQTRGLAKGLHPIDLDAESLTSVLNELAVTTEKLFAIRCTFKTDGPILINDAVVAVHLYRISQEAINNAIKHGKAKNIGIELSCDSDKSVLMVKSDGLDFPGMQVKSKGMGLQIMDHRAEMIGGSLDIRKAVEGGTIVTCEFPNKKASL